MRRMLATAIATTAALAAGAALAQDVEAGGQLYEAFCLPCHGATGAGDGPMAGMLTIVPADLAGLAAANEGVFPVEQVVRQIDGRDTELAHSGVMPLFGRYFEGTEASIASEDGQPIVTSAYMADLVAYLASLQR